jgi:hypothetical protein
VELSSTGKGFAYCDALLVIICESLCTPLPPFPIHFASMYIYLFFRGLRDHQLVKHGNSYEVAMEAVAADKAQLIKYTSNGAEIEQWEREYGLEKVRISLYRSCLSLTYYYYYYYYFAAS